MVLNTVEIVKILHMSPKFVAENIAMVYLVVINGSNHSL